MGGEANEVLVTFLPLCEIDSGMGAGQELRAEDLVLIGILYFFYGRNVLFGGFAQSRSE